MKLQAYIAISFVGLLVQGCSLAILGEDIERTDLSSLEVGATREEVEAVLGKPISNEPDKLGKIAVNAYDKGASPSPLLTGRDYLDCWGILNIFCEPILTPIALFRRQELYESQQGQLGIHYGPDDTVMDVIVGEYDLPASYWETLSRAVCGDPDAQYRVGDAFEFGRGVRASDVEAYKWYTIAASRDNRLAARVKDLLVDKMSPDRITTAEKLVAEWESGCRKERGAAAAAPRRSQGELRRESSGRILPVTRLASPHEQPLVAPQVVHFMHVPLRTSVKLPQSLQESPS